MIALPSMRQIALAVPLVAALAAASRPAPALAQGTPEQQQACAPDAIKLCGSTIPDVSKTTACMKAHVGDLSPRCRSVFFAATGGAPAAKTASERKPASETTEAKTSASEKTHSKSRVAAREERHVTVSGRQSEVANRAVPSTHRSREEARAEPQTSSGGEAARSSAADLPERHEALSLVVSAASVGPARLPGLADAQANILRSCRAGLIDPFTCRNTIQVFGLNEP